MADGGIAALAAASAARGRASPKAACVRIHKYFSPYDSPYQAFINYMNCIQDLKEKAYRKAGYAPPQFA